MCVPRPIDTGYFITALGAPIYVAEEAAEIVDEECGLGDEAGGWFLSG